MDKDPKAPKIRDYKPATDERLPHLTDKQPMQQTDICCSKHQKMTQSLEKKLAVYKMCNETLFYTKHSLKQQGETDDIILRHDDDDDGGYSLRKKRKNKNEAPSNKLRRMIIDDAKELKEMFGKPHEQQKTLD
jgi:hypothetical protein